MRLFILIGIFFALSARALEVRGFPILTLKPNRCDGQFMSAQLLLKPEDAHHQIELRIVTVEKNTIVSVMSNKAETSDSEGRWQSVRELPTVGNTRAHSMMWYVEFSQLRLPKGPVRIQYELAVLLPTGERQRLTKSQVFTLTPQDPDFSVEEHRTTALIREKSLPFDPHQALVHPIEESETETQKVVYFATNRTVHKRKRVGPVWSRFEPFPHEYPEMETVFGVSLVRVPKDRPMGTLLGEDESLPKDTTFGIESMVEYYRESQEERTDRSSAWKLEADADLRAKFFRNKKTRRILVYLHGYNSFFEPTLLTAAQLKVDFKWPGDVITYSWPTHGKTLLYLEDLRNAEKSVPVVASFLGELKKNFPDSQISFLVHSMGNFVFLNAVSQALETGLLKEKDFHRIVLAAPDVSATKFRELGPKVVKVAEKVTYYFSDHDFAVLVSKGVRLGASRAGQDLVPVEGMDAIDATDVTKFSEGWGHDYFATVEAAMSDMTYFLREGLTAEQREGTTLKRVRTPSGGLGWKLKK